MRKKTQAFQNFANIVHQRGKELQQDNKVRQESNSTSTTPVASSATILETPVATSVSPDTSNIKQSLSKSSSTNSPEVSTTDATVAQSALIASSNLQDEFSDFTDEELLDLATALSLEDENSEMKNLTSTTITSTEVYAKAEEFSEEKLTEELEGLSFSASSSATTTPGSTSRKDDSPEALKFFKIVPTVEELASERFGSDSVISSGFGIISGNGATFFKAPCTSTLSKEPAQDSVNDKAELEDLFLKGPSESEDNYPGDLEKFLELQARTLLRDPVDTLDGNFYERALLQKWYDAGYRCCPEAPNKDLGDPATIATNDKIKNMFLDTIKLDDNNNNKTQQPDSSTPSFNI